jgi:hypothetical protein
LAQGEVVRVFRDLRHLNNAVRDLCPINGGACV